MGKLYTKEFYANMNKSCDALIDNCTELVKNAYFYGYEAGNKRSEELKDKEYQDAYREGFAEGLYAAWNAAYSILKLESLDDSHTKLKELFQISTGSAYSVLGNYTAADAIRILREHDNPKKETNEIINSGLKCGEEIESDSWKKKLIFTFCGSKSNGETYWYFIDTIGVTYQLKNEDIIKDNWHKTGKFYQNIKDAFDCFS